MTLFLLSPCQSNNSFTISILLLQTKTRRNRIVNDEYIHIQKHCLRCRISQQISRGEEASMDPPDRGRVRGASCFEM